MIDVMLRAFKGIEPRVLHHILTLNLKNHLKYCKKKAHSKSSDVINNNDDKNIFLITYTYKR